MANRSAPGMFSDDEYFFYRIQFLNGFQDWRSSIFVDHDKLNANPFNSVSNIS